MKINEFLNQYKWIILFLFFLAIVYSMYAEKNMLEESGKLCLCTISHKYKAKYNSIRYYCEFEITGVVYRNISTEYSWFPRDRNANIKDRFLAAYLPENPKRSVVFWSYPVSDSLDVESINIEQLGLSIWDM